MITYDCRFALTRHSFGPCGSASCSLAPGLPELASRDDRWALNPKRYVNPQTPNPKPLNPKP